MLDLAHHPLVGLVGASGLLGDQPVQPGALELLEPAPRPAGVVVGDRGEVDRRPGLGQRLLQPGPALGERALGEVLVAQRQQVERDEAGRGLDRQQVHPARGRVDALLQHLELQRVALPVEHHDLAVDHRALREVGHHRVDDLGEVPGHRPLVAAADLHLVAVAEDDRAEAVPLRLVELAGGDIGCRLGQHRLHGRHHGQVHPAILPVPVTAQTAEPPGSRVRGRRRVRCGSPRRSWRRPGTGPSPTCCPGRATRRCGCCSAGSTRGWSPRPPGTTSRGRATGSGRRCTAPGSRRGCCAPAEQGELAGLGLGHHQPGARATARADELTAAELVAGGQRLRELVERGAAGLARRRRDHRLPHGVRARPSAVDRPAAEPWARPGSGCCPTPAA